MTENLAPGGGNRTRHKPPPRLKSFDYAGSYAYSLTLCCEKRQGLLADPETVTALLSQLGGCANRHGFDVFAYCFMPDHLHLLVCGRGESSALRPFVRLFKQVSGYWYEQRFARMLWQLSYYDHVVRKEENIAIVARYIFENPLRRGLVATWGDYEFMGPPDTLERVFTAPRA